MQTERVTFLTSRDHKAALEAYAASNGQSVGHVVREATSTYMAEPRSRNDEDAMMNLLADELEAAIPKWNAHFDSMEASIDRASKAIREAISSVDAGK
jgi:signal transduction protein with GAF and PtsI domain